MNYYALLNNKYQIKPKDGFIISEELSETLDSGVLVFNTKEKLNVESFDEIKLSDVPFNSPVSSLFKLKQLVDTYDIDITNPFQDNEIRKYTINLFSETKLLERITCPNLAITKAQDGYFKAELNPKTITGGPEDGFQNAGDVKTFVFDAPAYVDNITTGIFEYSGKMIYITTSLITKTINFSEFNTGVSWNQNGQVSVRLKVPDDAMANRTFTYNFSIGIRYKRSIYYYIKLYCDMYAPKIHIKNGNNIVLKSSIAMSNDVKNRFKSTECPEFQWNNSTLREVLNDLMMVDNCIPILKNNSLYFLDLTKKGDEIDTSKLNGANISGTSADYCSELTLPMSNSIGKQLVKVQECVGFRNSSDYILTTENMRLETQHPIYKIEKLTMLGVSRYLIDGVVTRYSYRESDITKLVYEKDVWNTLPIPRFGQDAGGTKCGGVYYERGSNIIDGFSFRNGNRRTMDYLSEQADIENTWSGGIAVDVRDTLFNIEYYTIDDRKLHIGKYLPTKHAENRIFDQQTSSYIDVNKSAIFEYFKVNRLGNAIKKITATYTQYDDIPNLGDYIDDEILFNRKIQFKDNVFIFEGYLTKYYLLQNYYTGVQSKRRSWAFVKGSEALTKYEIDKLFMEFSYDNKMTYSDRTQTIEAYNITNNTSGLNTIEEYFLSPFKTYTAEPIKYSIVKVYGMNEEDITTYSAYYSTEINSEIMGNSIVSTFGFNDNVSVGSYLYYDSDGNNSQYISDIYKYVDNYAETKSIQYNLTSSQDIADGEFTYPSIGDIGATLDVWNRCIVKSRTKPLVSQIYGQHELLRKTLQVSKDNAEIIKISTQFEFCSDTDQIVIGKRFYELQKYINTNNNDISNLKIAFSTQKPNIAKCETLPDSSTIANLTEKWTNFAVGSNDLRIFSTRTEIDTLAWNTQYYAYIYDSSDNNRVVLCVATTREELDNGGSIVTKPILIYLNALKTRDCNIYDSVEDRNIIGDLSNGIYELIE